jgi:biotin carboxyl carrier protein
MNGEYILRIPPKPGQKPGEPAHARLHAGQQLEVAGQKASFKVLRTDASGLLVVQWGTQVLSGIMHAKADTWILQVLNENHAPRALQVRPAAIDALEQTARSGTGVNGSVEIQSPIPGLVKQIKVKAGDTVEAGQTLVILEAMKMENELPAPCAGTIQGIEVKTGQTVAAGDLLLKLKA